MLHHAKTPELKNDLIVESKKVNRSWLESDNESGNITLFEEAIANELVQRHKGSPVKLNFKKL